MVGALFISALIITVLAVAIRYLIRWHPCYHGKTDRKKISSTEHAGAVSLHNTTSEYNEQTLREGDASIEYDYIHSNTPTEDRLQGSVLYSCPRYHGQVDQERGPSVDSQTEICDEDGYTLPDLYVGNTAAHVNTPTQVELQGSDFGHSDPRYRGEGDQETSSLEGSQNSFGDENGYTLPDLCVGNTAAHVNTPTQVELLGSDFGYSDPRYRGEGDQETSSLEGSQNTFGDENGYTLPDFCVGNTAAHVNTPTSVDLEGRGHSTQADLEADGYSDPRYFGD